MRKLDKKNIEDILALTPMQEGMLSHYLGDPGSQDYFEQLSLEISGEIEAGTFEKAWDIVTRSNEMLRTVFRWEKVDRPIQIILKKPRFQVEYHDLTGKDTGKPQHLEMLKAEDRRRGFDLREVPFRVTLCKLREDRHVMVVDNHHILYDGWSNGIILKEFLEVYHALVNGREPVKPVKTRFKEFIRWNRDRDIERQKQFWRDYLAGFDSTVEIPFGNAKSKAPGARESRGNVKVRFPAGLREDLEVFGRKYRVTPASIIYSAWGLLLQKYNNSSDVMLGTTVSGRSAKIKGIEHIVGLFINTLPLRVTTRPGEKTADLVSGVNHLVQRREAFENTPLADVKEYGRLGHKENLFDFIAAVENYPLDAGLKQNHHNKLSIRSYSMVETTDYELTVGITMAHHIELNFIYREPLLGASDIHMLSRHFRRLLENMLLNPGKEAAQLDILSEEEKKELLYTFDNTAVQYPADKTIHRLFEEQVEKSPYHTAAVFEDKQLTYRHLNRCAHRLAVLLRKRGVGPDTPVLIMLERSLEMIIGTLGILKAGGAYLPVDPGYPGGRIAYQVEDSGARVTVTTKELAAAINPGMEIIPVENREIYEGEEEGLEDLSCPPDMAYIIYTSGTTGKPKGVMIEHRNVVRLFFNDLSRFDFNGGDVWTMFHSHCFDFSVWEMYGALLFGGKLVVISGDTAREPRLYRQQLIAHDVTILNQTPSAFYHLTAVELNHSQRDLNLRYVIFGGEALHPVKLKEWKEKYPVTKLINMFGITETTVHVTYKEIGAEEIRWNISNIGKPIPTLRTYILDRGRKLVPVGVPGELFVAGAGVARGYLNRVELTAGRFPGDPFKPGQTLYRSGDLARSLPGGEMEYLGRMDHQVQLRGYRIELGEIESQLLKDREVDDAVVLSRAGEDGDNYICAYIVSRKHVEVSKLRERLSERLLEYMLPSYFIQVDKIPLTGNGKVDRKALPEPGVEVGEDFTAPSDAVEKKLAEIWSGVLGIDVDMIGIDADFFRLGGHSLKATALQARIHKKFHINISIPDIFGMPTIRALAQLIKESGEGEYSSIEMVEEKEFYPLSPAQKRLYILQQVELDSTAYNIHAALLLEGRPDRERLSRVFKTLIQRHESLRTSFEIIDGEPMQRIHPSAAFQSSAFPNEAPRPPEAFNLSQAPLLRVGLEEIAENNHLLVLDMHHIISDGTSIEILKKEFTALYQGETLPALKARYKDYVHWLNGRREEGLLKEQEEYWLKEFDEEVPVLELPIDYTRPALQRFDGEVLRFEVDNAGKAALKTLAGGEGATLFMVLLAIFNIFLAKLSGGEENVIGTPVEDRNHEDLRQVIGMFVNTLALKNVPQGSKTFKGFLKDVKARALAAFENRDYPFEELVEQVTVKRDAGRNPLFDVMFVMEESGRTEIDLGDLKLKPYEYESRKVKFDMLLRAINIKDGICFELDYCTALFKRETVERFIVYFKKILSSVLESPGKPIDQLEIITAEEKKQVLFEFNDARAECTGDGTVNEMFESLVEKKPGHIAAVFEGSDSARSRAITYGELNERANRLTAVLRSQGLKTNAPAALMVERSLEMVVGIMGILKAGGAYLPLDPAHPLERMNYILEDSDAAVLLTQEHLFKKENRYSQQLHLKNIVFLDDERMYTRDAGSPGMNSQPFHLAYVLYTSGTTGQPKGVMVEHGNVCNLAAGLKQKIYDRYFNHLHVCLVSPYVFDASVKQIFAVLLLGHTLYIVPEETRMDGRLLLTFYQRHQVDISDGTPAHIRLLTEAVREAGRCPVKHFLIGGEALSRKVVGRFFERFAAGVRISNVYGPTECTVDATLFDLPGENVLEGGTVPIGRPMPNVQVYILDGQQRLQPVGITGELWIGGAGVARGYINRPLLTAGKFFLRGQQKIYRSGDLCRWLPDGNIEFVGRVDRQVKIRGFRIELEEIENRLLHEEGITGAVVIVREDKEGTGYLCAYITAEQRMAAAALKTRLSQVLPGYMIPAFILQLEKMPLTRNGKLNRKALPISEIPIRMEDYEAPRDPVQEKIAAIYSEVLEIDKGAVSISSSFFDLGGHSLKATLMTARIHKAFNVRVPLAQVFKTPTVKELAGYVKKADKQRYASAAAAEKREYYPLSSAQKRLYIIQQIQEDYAVYNTPSVAKVSGVLEKQKMEAAFKQLINRHESLRTCFEMIDGEPMQRIHPGVAFEMEYYDLAAENAAEGEDQAIIKQFIRPFDLSQAPLIRVGLITVTEQEHILMVDMHHIVSDAISLRIFINDFFDLYSGQRLEPLALQYTDFSQWQNSDRQQEEIKKQEVYWLGLFAGSIPVLDMPLDFPRPAVYSYEGDKHYFTIDQPLTRKLKHLVEETGVTLNILFLAAYNVLLSRYTTQQDIVVGIPVSGRRHIELQGIIGFFANMLAMRNQPLEEKTFRVFLEEVKENSLKAYENQDYQFDELIWKLNVPRKPGRHPMVDTVLVVRSRENRNEEIMEINRQNLKMVPYRFEWEISHFDLMLHAVETRDSIDMLVEYGTLLFKQSTIEELAKHFTDILEQVTANYDLKIKEIKIAHDFLPAQSELFYDEQDDWIEGLAKSA